MSNILNKKIIFSIVIILIIGFLGMFSIANAGNVSGEWEEKGFVPLQPIPGVITTDTAKDPSEFFNGLFKFGIIIAGFLAVIMVAYGGIKYMSTDAVSGKGEGKEIITAALTGLLLILFSYILLKTINPDILKFDLFNKSNSGGGTGGTPPPPPPPPPSIDITDIDKKYNADLQRWIKEQPDGAERAKEIEAWRKEFGPSIIKSEKEKLILFFAWKGY